jgi:hypothetical protein
MNDLPLQAAAGLFRFIADFDMYIRPVRALF